MNTVQRSLPDSTDPRWQLAQRVADSRNLRKCPKLRGFLLYVCENALFGEIENIREQLIGARVFGRSTDYNISEDNIVRVEARELRKRLQEYFADDGRDEPMVIDIPKGGYLPVFSSRVEAPIAAVPESGSAATTKPAKRGLQAALVLAVWSILLAAGTIWLFVSRKSNVAQTELPPEFAFYADLLGPLAKPGNPDVQLILSNPKVVLYYGRNSREPHWDGAGLTIPAPPELKKSFGEALNNIDRDSESQYLHVTREDYTGIGEAVSAFHLGRLMQQMHRPVHLLQGRFLTWDQVQEQNLILLGSPHINDWTYRNVAVSNFHIDRVRIHNEKPLPGEQSDYVGGPEPGPEPGTARTDYGVIKMLRSPYGYNLLMLAGISSPGTAGVGEFFADPAKMKGVYERIRAATPGQPFPSTWEALIRLDVRDGVPVESSLVAFRPTAVAR